MQLPKLLQVRSYAPKECAIIQATFQAREVYLLHTLMSVQHSCNLRCQGKESVQL